VITHGTETGYAYLAGLIDGEGYVGGSKGSGGYWHLATEISMTHRPTIDWLNSTFGGCIYTPTVPKPNARQYWKWTITGGPMREHLPRALPYLITKAVQVELMLQILAVKDVDGKAFTVAQRELKESLCLQLKALNRRGL
jgi:hypothetical protein